MIESSQLERGVVVSFYILRKCPIDPSDACRSDPSNNAMIASTVTPYASSCSQLLNGLTPHCGIAVAAGKHFGFRYLVSSYSFCTDCSTTEAS